MSAIIDKLEICTDTLGLAAQGLSCVRGDRHLFRDVSFNLKPGQIIQILGDNGAGKTSLLKILAGLLSPSRGEVTWQGVPLVNCRQEYYQHLNYIGHQLSLKAQLTPRENLKFYLGVTGTVTNLSIDDALARVGLSRFADELCYSLSSGQQRRVNLARLLLRPCTLWMLDEPLTALDHAGIELMQDMLQHQRDNGGMVVLSSHQRLSLKDIKQVELTR